MMATAMTAAAVAMLPRRVPWTQFNAASSGDEPLRGLMGEDARALLKAALKELPERKRQCVILYYGRGLNLSEIARVFDVTPSRISQILSSAREELREILFDQIDLDDLAYGRINAEAL